MASSGEEKEETKEDEVTDSEVVLDLCGRKLKRLDKAPANQAFASALVLDNNQLQNLANLDSYGELERLSIAGNQIVRMYWFARMYSLRILNLPNNNIANIEGMRELAHLIHLNLAGNHLKSIEGLSYSSKLEHLNLAGNYITHINDLSMLKNIKELFLHRNRLGSLYRCSKYLPSSLIILTLSDNNISDLNDLSNLSTLSHLEQFTILNNPALDPIQPTDESGTAVGPLLAFDYRPYVINWCLNLKVLDGYKITPKESLKAEWLYSQGKGRGFQVGEHPALVQYLSGVCLAGGGWGGADLPDDDEKLAKILQLAKQHQHDVRHAANTNGQDNSESSSGRGSRSSSHHDSPATIRRSVSRSASLRRNTAPTRSVSAHRECHRRTHSHSAGTTRKDPGGRGTTGLMHQTPSYHVELSNTLYGGELRTPDTPSLMTQSMDPNILAQLAGTVPKASSTNPIMYLSLGAEQMSHTLGLETAQSCDNISNNQSGGQHMATQHVDSNRSQQQQGGGPSTMNNMAQSMGAEELKRVLGLCADPMTQSLGPEQLSRKLGLPVIDNNARNSSLTNGEVAEWPERMIHPTAHHNQPRPTTLFAQENDNNMPLDDVGQPDGSSQLSGSTSFVPAPESIMSPEFQSGLMSRPAAPQSAPTYTLTQQRGQQNHQYQPSGPAVAAVGRSNSVSRRPPPSIRPASAPHSSPKTTNRTSVGRPRTSPMKSPAPGDAGRGSPPRTHRSSNHSSGSQASPPTLPKPKPSPRPTQRSTRSTSADTQGLSSRRKKVPSPSACYSDAESDNTDSEVSVSKLQTIKSIAAERKQTERRDRETLQSSHTYNPDKYKGPGDTRRSSGRNVSFSCADASAVRRSSNSSGGSSGSNSDQVRTAAAITLQRYWRGYHTRNQDPNASKIRDDIRHTRAEKHIQYLTEKLHTTEVSLERERRLRHMQLDAIRTLWREIQKLHATKKDGVTTPGTPMTPLTPLTPLTVRDGLTMGREFGSSSANKTQADPAFPNNSNNNNSSKQESTKDSSKQGDSSNHGSSSNHYSEESVNELQVFCSSLQGQVTELHESLSMVTQVMNAFCNLPGSQNLLSMSQSSGSGVEGGGESPPVGGVTALHPSSQVPLSESVTSLTTSIRALTTSIVKSPSTGKGGAGNGGRGAAATAEVTGATRVSGDEDSNLDQGSCSEEPTVVISSEQQVNTTDQPQDMATSRTSLVSMDQNSTALDASTLSVDSTEGCDADHTGRDEPELSESSQSSLSGGSLSGSNSGPASGGGSSNARPAGPLRPSSLPVPRPHTPCASGTS